MHYCIIVPTYNNAGTIADLLQRALAVVSDVIVVNDGCTDNTQEVLKRFEGQIVVVSYPVNRGKGYALKRGFQKAKELGYDYAVTIDADGQHFPEDIPLLLAAGNQQFEIQNSKFKIHSSPSPLLVVGCRNLNADGMPTQNTFANRFSNFWFRLQTAQNLPDTQSGFRLYDLNALPALSLLTNRYESELELLVFSAWRGVRLIPVTVRVYYPPENERVSHFRPFWDFFRISVLNTFLCFAAILYGYPKKLIRLVNCEL